MSTTRVGVISDTHGVYDEEAAAHFNRVQAILHAGDIGHHGGAEGVVERLASVAPVTAVKGNVDEGESYPDTVTLELNGWRILMTHILGVPPKVTPSGAALVAEHKPDIAISGHSHIYGCTEEDGVLYINPGSAGPARFKLGRSIAMLELPPKGSGKKPRVQKIELQGNAPPRLASASGGRKRRRTYDPAGEIRGRFDTK